MQSLQATITRPDFPGHNGIDDAAYLRAVARGLSRALSRPVEVSFGIRAWVDGDETGGYLETLREVELACWETHCDGSQAEYEL
jgi:hypothetical protein